MIDKWKKQKGLIAIMPNQSQSASALGGWSGLCETPTLPCSPTRLHTFSQQQKITLMMMHKMGLGTWDHVAKNMGQHQEYALWGQECGTGNGEPWGHEHGTRRPRTWNHEFAQHLFSCNCFINRKLVHEPEHACHLFQA